MRSRHDKSRLRVNERGSALIMLAATMVTLLGVAGLAVDLVQFYAVRAEAQRAADAAALDGAQMLVSSGCAAATGGCVLGGSQQAQAIQRVKDVAGQNYVAGETVQIQDADVTFSYPNPQEPEITVVVARDAAHGNAVRTVFGKIFGVGTVNISASATAEGYNPPGVACIKPWILPNCDPNNSHNSPKTNPNCSNAPLLDPGSLTIVHPGPASSGGIFGEQVTLKAGSPGSAAAPGQYYAVRMFVADGSSFLCPDCAGSNGSNNGGSLYRTNISCCNPTPIACGLLPISLETGALTGPTKQGVQCLINEQNSGANGGQDILGNAYPLSITGGSNNPLTALRGVTGLTQSSSIVTIPLYPGDTLSSGSSTVQVIGFLRVFITDISNQGDVHATILNISSCGSGGGGGSSTDGGGMLVRLIRQ
jgi:Flp pilus assembly protein TadG